MHVVIRHRSLGKRISIGNPLGTRKAKTVLDDCEPLIQASIPVQVIDKHFLDGGLLAHLMIATISDHLPCYRQKSIFVRAGLAIPRSTLAQGMT
jgi:transposase